MERENKVIPECYVDTNLMNVLLEKLCNHQKGCTTVCKTLDERLRDEFAIAVIDKDKREPKAVEEFELIGSARGLHVSKHRSRPHYMLQIDPAVEVFIMDAAEELGVNLADFELPTELNALRKKTKTVSAKEDEKFARLFRRLRGATNMRRLEGVLRYLLDARYTASADGVRKLLES